MDKRRPGHVGARGRGGIDPRLSEERGPGRANHEWCWPRAEGAIRLRSEMTAARARAPTGLMR